MPNYSIEDPMVFGKIYCRIWKPQIAPHRQAQQSVLLEHVHRRQGFASPHKSPRMVDGYCTRKRCLGQWLRFMCSGKLENLAQKLSSAGILRIVEKCDRGAMLYNHPAISKIDVVGYLFGKAHFVCNQHASHPVFC